MDAAKTLATYADLLELDEGVRAEIIAGELTVTPAPLPRHGRAQRAIGRFVGGPFDDDDGLGGPGGWWILPEVDVRFAEHDIVRPDLSGWRRERLEDPWDMRPIDVIPDWICEILSPTSASHDRVHKSGLYAQHGVEHYWVVDPVARTLEAWELREGKWLLFGAFDDQAVVRIAPFDAVELQLARLFPPEP
jgi:Uma2 family endonuclease